MKEISSKLTNLDLLKPLRNLSSNHAGIETLYLVGGITRDILLKRFNPKKGNDYDFEVHYKTKEAYLDFMNLISQEYNLKPECLPFEIFRFTFSCGNIFEFSPPRTEKYLGRGPFTHNDLRVTTYSTLPIEKSCVRRDFTLNAIYYDLFKEEVIDPLGGIDHLILKELHFCGEDFYKDPVRFLRCLRFNNQFNFALGFTLENFDLTKLHINHFNNEYKKSGNIEFIYKASQATSLFKISLPNWWENIDLAGLNPDNMKSCKLNLELSIIIYMQYEKGIVSKDDALNLLNQGLGENKKRTLDILSFIEIAKRWNDFHGLNEKYFIGEDMQNIFKDSQFLEFHKIFYKTKNYDLEHITRIIADCGWSTNYLSTFYEQIKLYRFLPIQYEKTLPREQYPMYKSLSFLKKIG